jgi:hypothetical protein
MPPALPLGLGATLEMPAIHDGTAPPPPATSTIASGPMTLSEAPAGMAEALAPLASLVDTTPRIAPVPVDVDGGARVVAAPPNRDELLGRLRARAAALSPEQRASILRRSP